jgi:hypothetical protein
MRYDGDVVGWDTLPIRHAAVADDWRRIRMMKRITQEGVPVT